MPTDPRWPAGLAGLGAEAPFCLWVRGAADLRSSLGRSVAVVGSRASTTYGERVAFDLADGLTSRDACVVSGGAYGIDAAAHRGAVARGGATLVVLAGGVDRAYPAGNARLLEAVVVLGRRAGVGGASAEPAHQEPLPAAQPADRGGGAGPPSWSRRRGGPGAMSTAHHAARLLRPVGAVPGPVTSAASAGCHRLLREGSRSA